MTAATGQHGGCHGRNAVRITPARALARLGRPRRERERRPAHQPRRRAPAGVAQPVRAEVTAARAGRRPRRRPACSTPAAATRTGSPPRRATRSSCSAGSRWSEARRVWDEPGLGGMPERPGIADAARRASSTAHADAPGAELLAARVAYGIERDGFDPDAWVYELTDGDHRRQLPVPDRMLPSRRADRARLPGAGAVRRRGAGRPVRPVRRRGRHRGHVLPLRDAPRTACSSPATGSPSGVPVFTPYIEIPELPRYEFEVVELEASELDDDGVPHVAVPGRGDRQARRPVGQGALPGQPEQPAVGDGPRSARSGGSPRSSATRNPNLIVITDDVYGTFVPGFRSLMAAAPRNTIGRLLVLQVLRLHGLAARRDRRAPGQRVRPAAGRAARRPRRSSTGATGRSRSPRGHSAFIDRMVADSRHVALNHTAGLSLPQQVQMVLFSLSALLDDGRRYKRRLREILRRRLDLLSEGTRRAAAGRSAPRRLLRRARPAAVGRAAYGDRLRICLQGNYEPVDFVFRLAEQESVVLLNGGGFDAPDVVDPRLAGQPRRRRLRAHRPGDPPRRAPSTSSPGVTRRRRLVTPWSLTGYGLA